MRAATCLLVLVPALAAAADRGACTAESPRTLTPVLELYTSEGCSSCPPADRWFSTLKPLADSGRLVAQAFHVAYWDSLGWVDRFAAPSHTQRQRQVARWNGRHDIYTPQLVRNGQDWRGFDGATASGPPARAAISMRRGEGDAFTADVAASADVARWAAYWTVTEDGHASNVKAGENAGEFLQHDFVVRQYVPAGEYRGPATLRLRAVAAQPGHTRRVNLVVFEPASGRTLQAVSSPC